MTLVVSDISRHGIVMVGDSAVTRERLDGEPDTIPGAVKVQYSDEANIGIAMWGHADVGGQRLDHWMAGFIENSIHAGDSVESVGDRIAEELNPILSASHRPWKDMVCGFHIAGYRDGVPVLFHVHCGHDDEPAHELRLHKDFPDGQKWSEYHFEYLLDFGYIHLRNGYHPIFGPLFDNMLEYSRNLRAGFNISFPQRQLSSRFEFYKLLVKFVAGILPVSGMQPSVNDVLSSIAFTENGLEVNEQLPLSPVPDVGDPNLSSHFSEYVGQRQLAATNYVAHAFGKARLK